MFIHIIFTQPDRSLSNTFAFSAARRAEESRRERGGDVGSIHKGGKGGGPSPPDVAAGGDHVANHHNRAHRSRGRGKPDVTPAIPSCAGEGKPCMPVAVGMRSVGKASHR